MSQFHTLYISNIECLTEASVAISFDIPDHLKDTFSFKAGQYITLKALINNEEIRRDYSICVAPNNNLLKVAVKAVEDGTFSKYANTYLKQGDALEVSEPNGRFIFEPNNKLTRTIVAFAAGSGITPILSIIRTLLKEEPFSNMVLVYGNRSKADTMFFQELMALKSEYGNRFHVHFIFSRANEEDALFGRIEKSTVNLILKNKYKDVTVDSYYLCGPEAMINTVKDTLLEHGVKESVIHFELFTSSNSTENTVAVADGSTKTQVIVDDETFEFTMSNSETILEAALKEDIDAPYSCQGGICSSCIARVTEGSASMRQNNILTDGEVADGLILTCQAQPTSSTIIVDYDDV